jgi:hypothetical protein
LDIQEELVQDTEAYATQHDNSSDIEPVPTPTNSTEPITKEVTASTKRKPSIYRSFLETYHKFLDAFLLYQLKSLEGRADMPALPLDLQLRGGKDACLLWNSILSSVTAVTMFIISRQLKETKWRVCSILAGGVTAGWSYALFRQYRVGSKFASIPN